MYPYHHYQQPYEQFYSQQNQHGQISQPKYGPQGFRNTQFPSGASKLVSHHSNIINEKANFISSLELTNLLDELFNEFTNFRNQKQQLTNLRSIITALLRVHRLSLAEVARHQFFTLLQTPLIGFLRRWHDASNLNENEISTFRNINQLLKRVLSEVENTNLYPSWLTDSSLLDTIALCLTGISQSEHFFDKQNAREARNFTKLLEVYDGYQKRLSEENGTNQEKLVQLLDPIVLCLTSNQYLDLFDQIQRNVKSGSKKGRFFLIRCPAFLTSYNGSRLEQTMNSLLSTMLPKYITLFDTIIPSASQWKRPMLRAVNQVLRIVNHGSGNTKILSTHLPFVDHILKLIDIPTFHNNLRKTLSNPETNLLNTAVSLLVHLISEPAILSHIKQKKVTSSFLRLTSTPYQPLVYNINTLLAYTTSEEDIKSMHNPGNLLSTVVQGLKTSTDQDKTVQLLETLKGLVQHDQLKEEILKQNTLSFLVECINKFAHTELTLLLETLWSLSFAQDIAQVLRANPAVMEKIQTTSKTTNDEALKKAADGLVWKLVREPAFLNKVAHQQEEGLDAVEEVLETTKQIIIQADGTEKVVTTTRRTSVVPPERVFQYDMMISYCHADKDLIKRIHKFLVDEGFKIWIDLNNMFGPAMEAMADAVENSEFVLLCMSDSYKQSTYCQAEAEYAFNCKRRLVPLIVRKGYKADGWLGFMIGSRIYVDYGTFDFETACGKLMDEVSRQRKRPFLSKVAQTTQPEKAALSAPTLQVPGETYNQIPSRKSGKTSGEKSTTSSQQLSDLYMKRKPTLDFNNKYIDRWVESDVLDFLFSHHLNELMPLCDKMDGPALIQLYKLCTVRHNRVYTILNEQLKLTHKTILPFGTYARFLSIMERVVAPPSRPQVMLPPLPSQSQVMLPPLPSQSQVMLPPLPSQSQLMLMPPPPRQPPLMLLPPLPPAPFQQARDEPPFQDLNSSYDIIVTSTAPPLQMLGMIERKGSRWQVKNPGQF